MKTCICEWCNKSFQTWPSRPGRFCSSQCRSEFAARQPKPHSKRKPRNQITWNCKQCGKQVTCFASRVRDTCSRKCARLYFSKKSVLVCKQCGEQTTVNNSVITAQHRQFCNRDCADKYQRTAMIGINNPNWKGGTAKSERGPNWQSQSVAARKRDNYTC